MVHEDHPLNVSDHNPISLQIHCDIPKYTLNTRTHYDWNKANPELYTQNLRSKLIHSFDNSNIEYKADIDQYTTQIQKCIVSALETSVPKRRFCSYKRPYWDDELSQCHNQQKRLRQIWVTSGRPRGHNYISYSQYKASKRQFANLLKMKHKMFFQKKYENIESSPDINLSKLWKHVRSKTKSDSNISSIKSEGIIYSTPLQLCSLWEKHYNSLLNEQPVESLQYDDSHQELIHNKVEDMHTNFDKLCDDTGIITHDFTINEVADICLRLPSNKSAGYDCITYECLKFGGYMLYERLAYLFNSMLSLVHIPDILKHSIIIPVYKGKKKPKTDTNSYRGISLTSAVNKTFEKLILNRLKPWLKNNNFPPPLQQAGREGINCVCLSYAVQEAISSVVNQGSKVFGCFLDINKAFDVIWWDGLLYKLSQIGIKDKLWFLFRECLQGSSARILTHGEMSNAFPVTRSIKQGGLLSMLFFTVFYHDIHEYVRRGSVLPLSIYDIDISSPTMADDTLLLSVSVNGLQTMLNNAYNYSCKWRLKYSPSKTKCITFGESQYKNSRNINNRTWKLGSEKVEEVTHYNYLGIILCSYGSSAQRTDVMSKKAYSILGLLKAAGFHSDGLSPITCSSLWQRMSVPSMFYGSEIWGALPVREIRVLEQIQKQIAKHIQGLHRRTHDEIVRGLLGWHTIQGIIEGKALQFPTQ